MDSCLQNSTVLGLCKEREEINFRDHGALCWLIIAYAMVADIVTTATAKDNVLSGLRPNPLKIKAENQTAVVLFSLTYLS